MNPFLYLRSCTRFVLALGLLLYGPLGLGALAKPPHPTRPASTPTRATRPSTLDPVAYYPFTGNANDGSGNGLNGTINGATLTTDRFGNANRAMRFDGNDNITFSGIPTTQTDNWTIATWVNLANLNQLDGAFVFNGYDDTSTGDGYGVLCNNGGPFGSQLLGLAGGVSYFNSGYTFSSTNTWYFVVMARSAGVTKFYVNGVQTSQTSTATPRTPTGFFIGSGVNSRYFSGDLDEVRVYDRAISEAEIQSLYTNQVYVNDENTTGDVYTTAPGNDATGNGSAAAPFRSIAMAQNAANAGATIFVDAGDYDGCVLVKSLTIKGPNAGIDPNTGTRVAEATVNQNPGAFSSFRPLANDITLDGLRLNDGITDITQFSISFTARADVVGSNLTLKNLITGNEGFGFINVNPANPVRPSNWTIIHNRFGKLEISSINGITISDNYVEGAGIGVYSASQIAITNNTIRGGYDPFFRTYGTGITGGEYNANVSDLTISGNDIRNCGNNGAIFLQGENTGAIRVMNNFITNSNQGVFLRNGPVTGRDYLVTNNSLSGNTLGIVNQAGGTLNAPCNWYGAAPPSASYFGGSVDYSTYLTTGTDHEPATPGFQPMPNSCGCAIAVSLEGGGPLCAGGTRQLTGTAGQSQTWSSGNPAIATVSNTGLVTGLAAGTVTISYTVIDGSGCSGTATLELTVNALPSPVILTNGPTSFCTGGSVTLSTAPFSSYVWKRDGSQVGTDPTFSATASGNYTVTVTDANGCVGTSGPVTVTVNPLPTPAISANGSLTFCQGNGVTLSTGSFSSFVWKEDGNQVGTAPTYLATASGSYTVTVTDANGCVGTSGPVIVTVNPLPTPTISAGGATTFCAPGSVSLSTGSFSSYVWKKEAVQVSTDPSFSATASGSYTVTVTDANGCVGTSAPVVVTVNPIPSAPGVSGSLSFCAGGSTTLTASGCSGSYLWSPGNQTTAAITVSAGGSYSVTCTENNCPSPATSRTVTVNPLPTPTISAGGPTTFCAPGSVSLSTGSFSSYVWKKEAVQVSTAASHSANASGSYTVTVTDANGCVGTSAPVVVTVNPLPVVSFSGLASSYLLADPAATLTGSPSGGAFGGSGVSGNTFTPSGAGVGTHTVTYRFTDGNGCGNSFSRNTTVTDQVTFTGAPVVGNVPVCAGQLITLTFSALNVGTATFSAQLSDANGDFGSPAATWPVAPGSNSRRIPGEVPSGSQYRIRVLSSAPVVTSLPSEPFRINGLSFSSTPTVSLVPACAGGTFRVSFTLNANCGYLSGNVFSAELSNAAGLFSAPTPLGSVNPGTTTLTIPFGIPAGTGYRVQIRSSNPAQVSAASGGFTINVPGFSSTPTVSLDNKCPGEAVRLSFALGCTFAPGNTFTAQLSNASGDFAAPVSLGTVNPGALNNVVIPAGTPAGNGYKIRVVSSNPVVTSAASAGFKVKACGTNREIAPQETGLRVSISPNPSPEGRLRIAVSGAEGQVLTLELFNATGQAVRQQIIDRTGEEETLDWDLSRQPAGLYLLRVNAGRVVKTLKVLR